MSNLPASASGSFSLSHICEAVHTRYQQERVILTFDEYFELINTDPMRHLRNAAQYLKAVFDHYGQYTVQRKVGNITRFRLFDQEFRGNEGCVIGQEEVQNNLYRVLSNFVRVGRINKLILLHGPNGSAKSSIVACLMAAMENYAETDAGAMYRFNWIFPNEKHSKESHIGFSEHSNKTTRAGNESFATLPPELIDARVSSGINEHPLFLLPMLVRQGFLENLHKSGRLHEDFVLSDYIKHGDLGKKSRTIYDALLNAYQGDYKKVLRHVQIERFFPCKKYASSAVTIEPQLSIDAEVQQITADRSVAALPKALANVNLYHVGGPLIDANRGILEYADLFKRSVESFKYLLNTIETSTISLVGSLVHLDVVFIASTNEKYLNAFKEHPDFTSFKGRTELIPVPYLLTLQDEIKVYEQTIHKRALGKPVAPHAIEVAAMWAILSRLSRPGQKTYPAHITILLNSLLPLEKLHLYDNGLLPKRLTTNESKDLKRYLAAIYEETKGALYYEGSSGISAREIRTVLLNASYDVRFGSLSAMAVLDELRNLVKLTSVYEFLREEPSGGYREHTRFIQVVEEALLDMIDNEARESMGMADLSSYDDLFTRYVLHVSHYVKKERLIDRVTGKFIEPSEELMKDIEDVIMPASEVRQDFRQALIGQIGAFALEKREEGQHEYKPDYRQIFPKLIERMETHFFEKKHKQILRNKENFLKYFSDQKSSLQPKEIEHVELMLKHMVQKFGYTEESARQSIAFLWSKRYNQPVVNHEIAQKESSS